MPRVVIVQYRLLHYRVELFERLRRQCESRGIELRLVHGQASDTERIRKDEGVIEWADRVSNRFFSIFGRDLLWQPSSPCMTDADVIVVMQENRILSNYALLLSRLWRRDRKIAYWGHGRNFQSRSEHGLLERWKALLIARVDWWFAYTSLTVDILLRNGMPADRITNLNNSIDNDGFRRDIAQISRADVTAERLRLGLEPDGPTALFCGSLYPDKRLDVLVEACDQLRSRFAGFALLVVGDGPSMPFMREAAASRPWLRLLGVRKGREKALYFAMSDVMLNPGLVGLHVVDAFCAGLVMVTMKGSLHSPEVAYLENGRNGLLTDDDAASFSSEVIALFEDPHRLERMRRSALADADRYTLDNMVASFADGLEAACALR